MKNFALVLLISLFSFSASAAATKNVQLQYFGPDQTVNYSDCTLEFESSLTPGVSLSIEKLKVHCVHPTYWIFDQHLNPVKFKIDGARVSTLQGEKIGTIQADGYQLGFEVDGQKVFLEVAKTTQGMTLQWSARSFDDVNFDLKAQF